MYKKILATIFEVLSVLTAVVILPAQASPLRLRVAFNQNQAPYHFVDERGNPAGLHIDMLKHIAQNIDCELELFPLDNSTECMEALNNGTVDIVLDITNRLEGGSRVTETLSEEIICIVSPKGQSSEALSTSGTAAVQLETITPTISVQLQVAQAAFDAAMGKYGVEATVIAMPYGGATLPYVE